MKLREKGEISLLKKIRALFPAKSRVVKVGIGDDGAVVSMAGGDLVATTDMMVEGVHFDLSLTTPFQLGSKLVSVNVSDVFAMGGRPLYVLLSMAMRGGSDESFLDGFWGGVKEACGTYGVELIGGDLSSTPDRLSFSATLLGSVKKPVRRSGARPGDYVYVTGRLGDSAGGLLLLKKLKKHIDFKRPINKPLPWKVMEPLLRRHLMPLARDPKKFQARATAMIDISDGLLIDLSRLCDESGTGVRIYEESIPVSPGLRATAAYLRKDPMGLALRGGEDYELLFTSPYKLNAVRIGEITGRGRYMVSGGGNKKLIRPEGYTHFEDKTKA